jgi:hypothetical protein
MTSGSLPDTAMTRKRGLAAALAVALLLGGPVGAADAEANRKDLAQCRGSDLALAVAACGHIVSDQDKPAPERADA